MSQKSRTQVETLMTHIEENWNLLNNLFDAIETEQGWDRKHGQDWTFADVPYHLSYCNEEILIRGVKAGADLPENEQELLASAEAINDWNARKFAERPAGQTPAQSVAQWRGTCEEIRRMADGMTDADLDSPFFMPLFVGWNAAREGFSFTRAHDYTEFMQLRIHMGREEPVPGAGLTREFLGRMLGAYPMFLNPEAAAGVKFNAVMAFTDPGVGAFTLHVEDGMAALLPEAAQDPDLVLTQGVVTYIKTLSGILDPAEAMQTGLVRVSDFENLVLLGKLFPLP